tara:strand:- start:550 stop:819 length:270 start_codon:yes stop_codon:yes gene_type:complete
MLKAASHGDLRVFIALQQLYNIRRFISSLRQGGGGERQFARWYVDLAHIDAVLVLMEKAVEDEFDFCDRVQVSSPFSVKVMRMGFRFRM